MYDIEECPVRGRRPVVTVHVGSVNMKWYKDTNDEIRTARNADFIWALLEGDIGGLSTSQHRRKKIKNTASP